MRAVSIALLAAALLPLAPAAARGGEPPPQIAIRLSYILGPGTKSCPPEKFLHDEVARRMGYDPFTPDAADQVVTRLSLTARSSKGTVEFHDSTGGHDWDDEEFTLPDNDCMALVTGIAIYLAYMFAPFAQPSTVAPTPPTPEPSPPAEEPVLPTQSPAQTQAAPTSARAARPSASDARPPPRRRPEIELGASPFVAFGIAPSVTVGAALHLGLHWPLLSFSIALEGRADLPASAIMDAPSHPLIKTSLVGGSAIPCWYPRSPLLLCGVVTAGRVAGESLGISDPKVGHSAYLGAGLRAAAEARFSDHLEGRVYGDMLGTIVPVQALIGGRGVWRTPLLTGDLGAALLVLF